MPSDSQYGSAIAVAYDALNSEIDYSAFVDFAVKCAERFSDIKTSSICEIACGTGTVACDLASRGYDVTACDISEDMLTVAENKARGAGVNVRFVLQDMRKTKMFGQKDMFICFLDSMNYLTSKEDIVCTLSSVRDNLKDGGIFVFDMNSKYKFENVYGENAYILEEDSTVCNWQNFYNPNTKLCHFYLSFFTLMPDGRYKREDEYQKERMYTVKQMKSYIEKAGFSLCGIFGGFDFSPSDENRDPRLFYVVKKEEKNEN